MPTIDKSAFTASELRTLRKSLPAGWKKTLAKEFKLSEGYVQNIFNGSGANDEVVFAAIEMAKEHKANINLAKQTIESLS